MTNFLEKTGGHNPQHSDIKVVSLGYYTPLDYLTNQLQRVIDNQETIIENQDLVSEDVKIIKHHVVKPKKQKITKLPLRDPATNEFLQRLLQKPRKKRERFLCYARFRVACVLLWATGLRINEIRLLTKPNFDTLFDTKKLVIYQSKVNDYRELYFSDHALELLRGLHEELKCIFHHHEFLAGSKSPLNWIKFINARLKQHHHKFNGNIKSHSFRVNYVTQFLRKLPLHEASKIVGHKDIKTTLMYDRYKPDVEKTVTVLNEIQKLH